MKVKDHMSKEAFAEKLELAQAQADTDFAISFVDKAVDNFEKYGEDMWFSQKQMDVINKLVADGER